MSGTGITANSLEGQIKQLVQKFKTAQNSGATFTLQEGRVTQLLYQSLRDIYEFGENLIQMKSAAVTAEFFKAMKVNYDARSRANPYIGFVKMVFGVDEEKAASRSQYSTVLQYANSEGVKPADFVTWLDSHNGIEKCRQAAVKAQASSVWLQRNAGKSARIKQSAIDLLARPSSAPVSLPPGITAPEGFAIVLAKVDASNNASIIHIVSDQNDSGKIDPLLLRLATQPQTQSSHSLDGLYRAIDLVVNSTPEKVNGNERVVMIENTTQLGAPAAIVQTISEAYSAPHATMTLAYEVGQLASGERWTLSASDARHFLNGHDKHDNWTLDENGVLSADGLTQPIQLTKLAKAHKFRVASVAASTKQFRATAADLERFAEYVGKERNDLENANKRRSEKRSFPSSFRLTANNDRLALRIPGSPRPGDIAETDLQDIEDDRLLAVSDIERLVTVLISYELDIDGQIMDSDIDDAALVMEAIADDDRLRIVMPTRTGSSYNQVCEDLR